MKLYRLLPLSIPSFLIAGSVVLTVSSYSTSPASRAQSIRSESSEPPGHLHAGPVLLNKMHLSGSPVDRAAPDRVSIPAPLLRHARATLLSGVDVGRSGTPCKMEGYTRLKYPEDTFVLSIQIAGAPPLQQDATSVTYVNQPSFRFVYPEGTRIIEFTAHYSGQGVLLDMLPVGICEYTAPRGTMAQAPSDGNQTIGLLSEDKILAAISIVPATGGERQPGHLRQSQPAELSGPRPPSATELAQDPNWISCRICAEWVYLEDAPEGFRAADWIRLYPDYSLPGSEWLNQQPKLKFASGPGKLVLRKHSLDLSTMFVAENDLLEVTGEWYNGRLMRVVKVRAAAELAAREYNWDAIGAGMAIGIGPFVWTGAKLVEAAKDGARSGGAAAGETPDGTTGSPTADEAEKMRFRRQFQGRTVTFEVARDDGGTFLNGTALILRDHGTGKKFLVAYNPGLGRGLTDERSLVGASVEVRFDDAGTPLSIKNLSNGWSTPVGSFSVDGYGW